MSDNQEWDFWEDEAKINCVAYNSQIDQDLINIFKLISEGKFNTKIAKELDLPDQYVELMQSILCHADWCDYGTSPRGCWIDHKKDKLELIEKLEKYYFNRWVKDEE